MTRGSISEYGGREHYLAAGKKEKGRITDESTQVAKRYRKAPVCLLRNGRSPDSVKRRSCPR